MDQEDALEQAVGEMLEALEQLGDELSSRNEGDLRFKVTIPEEPPAVRLLAELINSIGLDWEDHLSKEAEVATKKNKELADAYNAMQAKNEDIQRDLETARRIQLRLIPGEGDYPNRPQIGCSGFYQSMENVGGDLYDIMRIGRNSYGVLIADVSGHGLPSALITSLVKIAFRSKARYNASSDVICAEVNEQLYPILSDLDYFVTAFFGILDLEVGTFNFTNCGHHPAILIEPEGDLEFLDSKGKFLGVFDDVVYESNSIILKDNTTIFAYTDGIIEARNFLDEEYTAEKMEQAILKTRSKFKENFDHQKVVSAVKRDLDDFTMGAPARDDQSIFSFTYLGTVPESEKGPLSTGNEPTKTNKKPEIDQEPSVAAKDQVFASSQVSNSLPPQIQAGATLSSIARQSIRDGEYEKAEQLLRAALILQPNRLGDRASLALVLHHTNRGQEAIKFIDSLILDCSQHGRTTLLSAVQHLKQKILSEK